VTSLLSFPILEEMFEPGNSFQIILTIIIAEFGNLTFSVLCWFMNQTSFNLDAKFVALVLNPVLISCYSFLFAIYLFLVEDKTPKKTSKKLNWYIVTKLIFGTIFFVNLFIIWSFTDDDQPAPILANDLTILSITLIAVEAFMAIMYKIKKEEQERAIIV
jgi:hypothetical protein